MPPMYDWEMVDVSLVQAIPAPEPAPLPCWRPGLIGLAGCEAGGYNLVDRIQP
jgi:hypothetical protein